ncbi:MAG: glycosyltransferase family 4 protein [Candidatus Omnitrophica bacterium]|nr:glycosyltransferase family 4 protein [Candidatus Omnitrophota bacterium]
MKILQTPVRFYPYIGGTEQVALYLGKELVNRGHAVSVICANEPRACAPNVSGVNVKRLDYVAKVANTNITPALLSEILKQDFDLLHTYLPHPWSADISAIASRIKKKPLFLTYCNDITGSGINQFIAGCYNRVFLPGLLKTARKIFIINKNYIESSPFLKKFSEKVVFLPLGVDLEKFKPIPVEKEEAPRVFFMAKLDNFHRYKGLEYLLSAVKELKSKIPIKLYVGGQGELLGFYKAFVKEHGLEGSVDFLGFLSDEELVRFYNLCDCFVLPSVSSVQEGFGLVAVEAMACKKPVIVTEVIGTAEEIKSHNAGIVVKSRDISDLASALESILINKEKAGVMGENGYRLVLEKYTWQKQADIIEKEYIEAIK